MEPQIVERDAFMLMGVLTIGAPDKLDYTDIWNNSYMPYDARIQPLSLDKAYYGAWVGEPGSSPGYLAGMRVGPQAKAPEGCVVRQIPSARYAVFHCTMSTISSTYQSIWQEWLPASQYFFDEGKSDFEQYRTPSEGEEMDISIWIPVKLKEAVAL